MREINILGITLKDYSLREEMRLTERFMNNGALNAIVYVSAKQLIRASEEEQHREWLQAMDLLVPGDVDLLKAANVLDGRSRMKEIENNDFLKEFLKRAVRAKCTVCLLANGQEQLENLKDRLLERQSGLQVIGEYTLEQMEEAGVSQDTLINDINDIAPSIIISKMPFEQYAEFVQENRMKINSDIILGLPEKRILEGTAKGTTKFSRFFYNKLLHRRVMKYNQEKTE